MIGPAATPLVQGRFSSARPGPAPMTSGYRSLSTAWAILRRGVGPDGAVVPRDLPVGGECHEAFTDGAMASLVPRALSHRASSRRSSAQRPSHDRHRAPSRPDNLEGFATEVTPVPRLVRPLGGMRTRQQGRWPTGRHPAARWHGQDGRPAAPNLPPHLTPPRPGASLHHAVAPLITHTRDSACG